MGADADARRFEPLARGALSHGPEPAVIVHVARHEAPEFEVARLQAHLGEGDVMGDPLSRGLLYVQLGQFADEGRFRRRIGETQEGRQILRADRAFPHHQNGREVRQGLFRRWSRRGGGRNRFRDRAQRRTGCGQREEGCEGDDREGRDQRGQRFHPHKIGKGRANLKRRARARRTYRMEQTSDYETAALRIASDGGVRDGTGLTALPFPDRPRERLAARGAGSLSDRELLMIVLNAGIKGKDVGSIAAEVVARLDGEQRIPEIAELSRLPGLGVAKACAVAAMLEFGRRRWGPCGARICSPSEAYPLVRHFADRRQERFICLSLNGAHEVLAVRLVTMGLVNRTIVHPREVFADPIVDRASAIIVAHNHPSGRLEPSAEDVEITSRLKATGDLLGIALLDHLIFTEEGYFSFLQEGKLD